MTTIPVLFIWLAPVFALITQAFGTVHHDLHVPETGISTQTLNLENPGTEYYHYGSSSTPLQQHSPLDGKTTDEDEQNPCQDLDPKNRAQPLFSLFPEFDAANTGGLPKGITFEGTVHRAVQPKYADTAFDFHAPSNLGANHRYTGVGRGGIYSGTSKEAVLGELAHYNIDPNTAAWVSSNIKIDNVLDLTNASTRKQLGISLDDIREDSYLIQQAIGDLVRTRGYNGILFPAARSNGTNFMEFINHVD